MFITQNHLDITLGPLAARIEARRRILTFSQRGPEHKLNEYFIQNYKLSLIQMCLKIWSNLKFLKGSSNEIVIILPNKDLAEIAQLITYGNRELQGSKILQKALKW